MDVKTGMMENISHDGFSYKLNTFESLLYMNSKYLSTGKFYKGEYNKIDSTYLDEYWEEILEIETYKDKLNDPADIFDDVVEKYENKISEIVHANFEFMNSNNHFRGTYFYNCDGQRSKDLIFRMLLLQPENV